MEHGHGANAAGPGRGGPGDVGRSAPSLRTCPMRAASTVLWPAIRPHPLLTLARLTSSPSAWPVPAPLPVPLPPPRPATHTRMPHPCGRLASPRRAALPAWAARMKPAPCGWPPCRTPRWRSRARTGRWRCAARRPAQTCSRRPAVAVVCACVRACATHAARWLRSTSPLDLMALVLSTGSGRCMRASVPCARQTPRLKASLPADVL